MSNLLQNGDQFIRSDEPANNGYGRNGYQGPASDLPSKKTTSGFLPQAKLAEGDDWQTRKVDASPLATAHGMRNPNANPNMVPADGRPVTTRK